MSERSERTKVDSTDLLDMMATHVVNLYPRGGNPLTFVFTDEQTALAFGAQAYNPQTVDEVLVAKVIAQHRSNAPRERTAVAGTLDGVVGNSGGEQ